MYVGLMLLGFFNYDLTAAEHDDLARRIARLYGQALQVDVDRLVVSITKASAYIVEGDAWFIASRVNVKLDGQEIVEPPSGAYLLGLHETFFEDDSLIPCPARHMMSV